MKRYGALAVGVIVAFIVTSMSTTHAGEVSLTQLAEYDSMLSTLRADLWGGSVGGILKTRRCQTYERGDYFVLSPECLLQGDIPELPFATAVDITLPFIEEVNGMYEIEEDTFYYDGADLTFDEQFTTYTDLLAGENTLLLRTLAHQGYLIRVPKIYIAFQQIQDYTFYASLRDTTSYGNCRKINYDLAMQQIDGKLLAPGELYNMNKQISNLPGYCDGNGEKFLFYEGVCGGSTQLFRNALLNPNLYVTKRYNHNSWYAGFYGSAVMGDDASMYEMSKQFEIKNIGDQPVYFKTYDLTDGNKILLSVYPKDVGLISYVEKNQEGALSARLVNHVYDERTGVFAYQQEWESRYFNINNETD